MRLSLLALTGALLLHPALAAAQEPPLAPTAMPAPPPPPGYYVPRLRYKTHSPALMAGGITLIALGGLSFAGSVTAFVADANSHGEGSGILSILVGIPLLVHGVGCLAGGIPMTVIGNRQIPAGYAAPSPSAVPSISVGRTTTLRWTF